MEQIQAYFDQLIRQGYSDFQAKAHFLKDETIKSKYKKIYIDTIVNYMPPIPMDIDDDFEIEQPPPTRPTLRRF
jgi:hypothetical protein